MGCGQSQPQNIEEVDRIKKQNVPSYIQIGKIESSVTFDDKKQLKSEDCKVDTFIVQFDKQGICGIDVIYTDYQDNVLGQFSHHNQSAQNTEKKELVFGLGKDDFIKRISGTYTNIINSLELESYKGKKLQTHLDLDTASNKPGRKFDYQFDNRSKKRLYSFNKFGGSFNKEGYLESLSFQTAEISEKLFPNLTEISKMNDMDSSQVLLAQQSMIASHNSLYPQNTLESKLSTNVLVSQKMQRKISLFNGIPDFVVLINDKSIQDNESISFDDLLEIRRAGWQFLRIVSLKFYLKQNRIIMVVPSYLVRDEQLREIRYDPSYPNLPDLKDTELVTFEVKDLTEDYIYEISGQQNQKGIVFFNIYSEKGRSKQVIVNRAEYEGLESQELDSSINFTYSYMNHTFGPLSGEYDENKIRFLQLQVVSLQSSLEQELDLKIQKVEPIQILEEE